MSSPEPQEENERCIACGVALKDGDDIYGDINGGVIHAACCGPERDGYCGEDGGPLKPGELIPEPWPWSTH